MSIQWWQRRLDVARLGEPCLGLKQAILAVKPGGQQTLAKVTKFIGYTSASHSHMHACSLLALPWAQGLVQALSC